MSNISKIASEPSTLNDVLSDFFRNKSTVDAAESILLWIRDTEPHHSEWRAKVKELNTQPTRYQNIVRKFRSIGLIAKHNDHWQIDTQYINDLKKHHTILENELVTNQKNHE